MSEDDIIECECGSSHFYISRDGLIECTACGHPTDDLMAIRADVHETMKRRGVEIVEPESYAH